MSSINASTPEYLNLRSKLQKVVAAFKNLNGWSLRCHQNGGEHSLEAYQSTGREDLCTMQVLEYHRHTHTSHNGASVKVVFGSRPEDPTPQHHDVVGRLARAKSLCLLWQLLDAREALCKRSHPPVGRFFVLIFGILEPPRVPGIWGTLVALCSSMFLFGALVAFSRTMTTETGF